MKKTRDENIPHQPPLLVKIAPDCSDEELVDIAAVVQSVGIDGIIISNTTVSRPTSLVSGSYFLTKISRPLNNLVAFQVDRLNPWLLRQSQGSTN